MDEKAFTKCTMVSRLPKFGARPQSGAVAMAHEPVHSSPEGKSAPQGAQNGMVRMSSFSIRWRKENGSLAAPSAPDEEAGNSSDGSAPHYQRSLAAREIKKPSAPSIKAGRLTSNAAPASLKPASQIPKSTPRVATKPGQSPPCTSKPVVNGLGVAGAAGRFSSGLPRPRAGSGSAPTPSGSRGGLSRSQDSLKPLPPDNMVRSQSLTHVRQLPSPTGLPIPRSFSFNKAVELAKPLADTQLRTRTPVLKHPLLPGVSRPGVAPGCSTPPTPIKKLLMPSCVLSKPSSLGYKLSRPTLAKLPRPLTTGQPPGVPKVEQGGRSSAEVSPVTLDALSSSKMVQGDLGPVAMVTGPASLRCLGEGLEDMSLSSASSLDRNDTSEDFLDDFDNLVDGSGVLLHPASHGEELPRPHPKGNDAVSDNRRQGAPAQMQPDEFPSDNVEWAGIGLSDCRDNRGPLALSPEVDFPPGSSLELSPSNSSGGTYMWDEEGLEPLCRTHPCGSYNSDINSTDILEHLESCELEDDDLMLDVELAEDVSLDPEGMSHFEHSERDGKQGYWRRRQHRWPGPDHFHNDNRRALLQLGRMVPVAMPDNHMEALDQMTLRLMAQDCTSVKTQLLKLKSLLQMDDIGVGQDELFPGALSPESSEDTSTSLQVEVLMREVQELREELKRKDKAIALLTQQASAPVYAMRRQCQQRAPVVRAEQRLHHDKATQTPWRGHAGVLAAPSFPRQGMCPGTPRASLAHRRQTSNTTAFQALPQPSSHPAKTSKLSPLRGPL